MTLKRSLLGGHRVFFLKNLAIDAKYSYSRWLFHTCFIFTPIPGEMIQFLTFRISFSNGLVQTNHQPDKVKTTMCIHTVLSISFPWKKATSLRGAVLVIPPSFRKGPGVDVCGSGDWRERLKAMATNENGLTLRGVDKFP